jgi:hypothetical protein
MPLHFVWTWTRFGMVFVDHMTGDGRCRDMLIRSNFLSVVLFQRRRFPLGMNMDSMCGMLGDRLRFRRRFCCTYTYSGSGYNAWQAFNLCIFKGLPGVGVPAQGVVVAGTCFTLGTWCTFVCAWSPVVPPSESAACAACFGVVPCDAFFESAYHIIICSGFVLIHNTLLLIERFNESGIFMHTLRWYHCGPWTWGCRSWAMCRRHVFDSLVGNFIVGVLLVCAMLGNCLRWWFLWTYARMRWKYDRIVPQRMLV